MTTRLVIYSLIHSPRNGRYHHETIPGIPACGVTLRRPHRAFAVDDELLCRACWGDESTAQTVAQTFDMGAENVRVAGITQDVKRAGECANTRNPGPDHDDLTEPGAS